MLIKFRYQIITETRFDFVIEFFTGTFVTSPTFTKQTMHTESCNMCCVIFCFAVCEFWDSFRLSTLHYRFLRPLVLHYKDTLTESISKNEPGNEHFGFHKVELYEQRSTSSLWCQSQFFLFLNVSLCNDLAVYDLNFNTI